MTPELPPRDGGRGTGHRRAGGTPGDGTSERPANWGLALDLGMRLGVAIVLGLGAGLLVDAWLHTSPVFTLIGILLGVAAAMYTIWEVAQQAMRR